LGGECIDIRRFLSDPRHKPEEIDHYGVPMNDPEGNEFRVA
jgi:hypothetical protein